MRSQEFWRERASSRVYAIRLTDGVVTAICGPLAPADVDPAFATAYAYAAAGAAEIEQRRAEFDLMSEHELVLFTMASG